MSVQIFLLGKILGIHDFLFSSLGDSGPNTSSDWLLKGRCRWVALLSEVLPRALLAELGLARILLGSSGGGQFLGVLPLEARTDADRFLARASREIESMSGGMLRLVTAVTENLGDWNIVRKRLNDEMQRKRGAPAAGRAPGWFDPSVPARAAASDDYFTVELVGKLQTTGVVGWSPATPARVLAGQGEHTWQVSCSPAPDAIPLTRHAALEDDTGSPAGVQTLAARSQCRRGWGVLRGDVDNFGVRLRRVQTIEEHIQLSVMYKQFFAGELELLCSMPEYWKKTSILYSGGDDFAIYGSWDSLIPLAREIHRLFHRFTEENLKEFPGPEGKTITMALAFAGAGEESLVSVYETAGERLELAKSTAKDCVYVLGRTLEWRQLSTASDLRETIERLAGELDSPKHFLSELAGVYRKAAAAAPPSRGSEGNFDKPWRIQRRLGRALGETSDRELQKLRTQLTNEMLVKSVAHVRLRPGGRVALEWARLLIEV